MNFLESYRGRREFLSMFLRITRIMVIRYWVVIHVVGEIIQYILWQPSHLVFWDTYTLAVHTPVHYSKNMNPGFWEYPGGWISSSENYFKFFLLIISWDLELFWDAKNFLVCFREFREVCVIRYCLIIHVFDEEIQYILWHYEIIHVVIETIKYILWQPWHLVVWDNNWSNISLASMQFSFGL